MSERKNQGSKFSAMHFYCTPVSCISSYKLTSQQGLWYLFLSGPLKCWNSAWKQVVYIRILPCVSFLLFFSTVITLPTLGTRKVPLNCEMLLTSSHGTGRRSQDTPFLSNSCLSNYSVVGVWLLKCVLFFYLVSGDSCVNSLWILWQ